MMTEIELNQVRLKVLDGTVTKEELIEAIKTLRHGRFEASQVNAGKKTSTSKPKTSSVKADFSAILAGL